MGGLILFEPGLRDWIFAVLVFITAVLFSLSCSFAVYTVFLRLANERKAVRWRRLEQAWEELILEVLAGSAAPAALWQQVRKRDELYFIDFLLRYARRLRGRERELLAELARPFLSRVVARTRGGDPERRARAVYTLSILGFRPYTGLSTYLGEMLAALDDPSPLVAMVAARALSRQEHPEYAGAVLARLHRFESWSPNFLASMLTAMGPEAAPALRQTYADPGRSLRVRTVAGEALRRLHDPAAADLAAGILGAETDRDLLAASLRLLAEMGRPEHLEPIRALCTSPDFVVRAQALSALGTLGEAEDAQRLRLGLEDPSPWVAHRAAQGLREAGRTEVLAEIATSPHPRAELARQILGEGRS